MLIRWSCTNLLWCDVRHGHGDALLSQHSQGEGGHSPPGRKQGQPWLAASNPRPHTNTSHEGRGSVRPQLAYQVDDTFSVSRRCSENTRRIRRWFGTCLRGSPKRSCARITSRMFTSMQGLHGWVVIGAEVLHSSRNARRTRKWGVATNSASAVIGYKTVAATAHELMKLSICHFLCEGADDMGV